MPPFPDLSHFIVISFGLQYIGDNRCPQNCSPLNNDNSLLFVTMAPDKMLVELSNKIRIIVEIAPTSANNATGCDVTSIIGSSNKQTATYIYNNDSVHT